MSRIIVKQVDGEWRVWADTGQQVVGKRIHLGDVLKGEKIEPGGVILPDPKTSELKVLGWNDVGNFRHAGWRILDVVDSPGLPCEVEGLEAAREALGDARHVIKSIPLDTVCRKFGDRLAREVCDEVLNKIDKALEAIS